MGQSVRLEAELEDDDALSVDFSENGRFGRNGIDFTAWPDHGRPLPRRAARPVGGHPPHEERDRKRPPHANGTQLSLPSHVRGDKVALRLGAGHGWHAADRQRGETWLNTSETPLSGDWIRSGLRL